MDFGKKVAKLRREKGMTQEDLGKVLSVTYQAVSKWERGESLPDIEMMSRIAKYFQVPIGYFVDGEENSQQSAQTAASSVNYIGMCTQCGKMLKEEEAYSLSPKIICRSCGQLIKENEDKARIAEENKVRYEKQKVIDAQRGHGIDVTLIIGIIFALACYIALTVLCFNSGFEDGGFYGALLFIVPLAVFGCIHALSNFIRDFKDDSFDDEVGYTRNLSLITAGAFAVFNLACFLVLYIQSKEIYYIFMLVLATVLSFAFISQFMWGGIIQEIFTAGGFTFKLPGFIFSLDIDSILFMIIAKLFLGILSVLVFIVTTILMTVIAILASVFTFIPSVISKSVKDTKVGRDN